MNNPAQIIIFRHAEKPEVGNGLSAIGQNRAHMLPIYFDTNEILSEFGKPIAIYAAAPIKANKSIRSIQTVISLATHFNLQINECFTKKNIHDLVENILGNPLYVGHTVVICWDRAGIPTIARLFGALESPVIWEADVFDRTWVIRFDGSDATRFKNLPQKLLPCDSQE